MYWVTGIVGKRSLDSPESVSSCFHKLRLKVVKLSSKINTSWAWDGAVTARRKTVEKNMAGKRSQKKYKESWARLGGTV